MRYIALPNGGRLIEAKGRPLGDFHIEITPSGQIDVARSWAVNRQPIPADHDPDHEAQRAKQGGCCGQPSA